MSRFDKFLATLEKIAGMPVLRGDPAVVPMARPPRNNPLGKIPMRKVAPGRLQWMHNQPANLDFNKRVQSAKKSIGTSPLARIDTTLPAPPQR